MSELFVFLAGAAIGACAVALGNIRVSKMVALERQKAKAQEERTRKELSEAMTARAAKEMECVALKIENANNAGYMDGFIAGRKETQSAEAVRGITNILDRGLKEGKRVSCSVMNR